MPESFTLLLFLTKNTPSGFDATLAVATWLIGLARVACPPRERPFSYLTVRDKA
jgi:hypothetical protein